MNETICRLCLQTVSENYQMIGETAKKSLKLNLDVSKETVMCMECANNLQVFLNLKSTCVDLKRRALVLAEMKNDVSFDPATTESTIDLKSVAVSKNETKCSFCTQSTENESLTSLLESKDNMFLVDTLQKYIPELSLSNNGELLSCETCLDQMQSVSSFLMKCLDIEENIREYAELKGTDDKGQIELQDVQQFIINEGGAYNVNKLGHDQIQETYLVKTEAEIKHEMEMDDIEPILDTEFVSIKSEQGDYDSIQEPSTIIKTDDGPLDISQCANCQDLTYESSNGKTVYKCECPCDTENKDYLRRHKSAHKITPVLPILKCETTHVDHQNQPKLLHKRYFDVTEFKCEQCSYETKNQSHYKRHILIHKSTSEIAIHKCELCPYKTKHKNNLKQHNLTHKSSSDVTMFKCKLCPYETKDKSDIKRHTLLHKSTSDILMLKCALCPYETKNRDYLKRHNLIHKSISELTLSKCELCSYETKHKTSLKRHMLRHKSTSELTMFKCDLCSYESKRADYLKEHKLIHNSNITMFKCELCSYESRRRNNLKRHERSHKHRSDLG